MQQILKFSLAAYLGLMSAAWADLGSLQTALQNPSVAIGQSWVDTRTLAPLYAATQYNYIWTKQQQGLDLVEALSHAEAHGLNPAHYHLEAIRTLLEHGQSMEDRLSLDLLMTDAFLRYARDVKIGRINPRLLAGEQYRTPPQMDYAALVQQAVQSPHLSDFLKTLPPQTAEYQDLVAILKELKETPPPQNLPPIEAGAKLQKGDRSLRVEALRARLEALGDLAPAADKQDKKLFDQAVKEAVITFQTRANITADGVVGTGTQNLLNLDPTLRYDQVRANMERLRWQPTILGDRYVYVNVPAYQLKAVAPQQPDLLMRVIVGRQERPTPLFSDQIRMIEFNPSWSVPPTIIKKDIYPHLLTDPSYPLVHKNVRIYTKDGVEVNPHSVNWRNVNVMSYRFRAPPGERNPLGTVKFLFPNRFDVYLHDTNERNLFQKTERAISSGCIRVAAPDVLTQWLMTADREDWTEEKRLKILASGDQTRLNLRTPVPVYIDYITVWRGVDGKPVFVQDIYGHDAALIAALQQADKASPPLKSYIVAPALAPEVAAAP